MYGSAINPQTLRSVQSATNSSNQSKAKAASLRTQGLSAPEEELIAVTWDAFKQPEGNVITRETLEAAFSKIGQSDAIQDLEFMIQELDEDGNGMIDEGEYWSLMSKKLLGEDDEGSFVQAFSMLDSNKDGFIPASELRHILMKEGQCPLSEQEADELLMFADQNGDDLIDYKEFLRWLANPRKEEILEKGKSRTKTLNMQSSKFLGTNSSRP